MPEEASGFDETMEVAKGTRQGSDGTLRGCIRIRKCLAEELGCTPWAGKVQSLKQELKRLTLAAPTADAPFLLGVTLDD